MDRTTRAELLSRHSSIAETVESGDLSQFQDMSLSEAIVLGLWNQGVRSFIGIFGHGSTDIAEVLRVYEANGLVKMINVRHETEAAHAATALRWMYGETAAVITSIGPGALHAFAGSLAAASNNIGVWHIYGDETSEDEGFNMQQIPKDEQHGFLKTFSHMGGAYSLQDVRSVFTALRRGSVVTRRRAGAGPFFLLAPMNKQPELIKGCNLLEFPAPYSEPAYGCSDHAIYEEASGLALQAERVTIKFGRGALGCGPEISELAELLDAAIVGGPSASGVVPFSNPRYMTVGGSKGSSAGNYAMNTADLVIVIGARAVCQWDSSGTSFKNAEHIINININPQHAFHYNRTINLTGDASSCLKAWIQVLRQKPKKGEAAGSARQSQWYTLITEKRGEWVQFKRNRVEVEPLQDESWRCKVLTQPAALAAAVEFADAHGAVKVFDSGDVQANGFQVVEDEYEWQTLNETGSSYMGFAASALLSAALTHSSPRYVCAFCGDGSFMMNPQILIDAVEHGVRGCIVLLDNRRMAAISSLQQAQYQNEYRTSDGVAVDYVQLASAVKGVNAVWGGTSKAEITAALEKAFEFDGLSLIHIPVYSGPDERGGMGVYGNWNVGNWCEWVQNEHHRIGL
jgi:3D-(3,5/4)-trihydroxycyclohexane-1,2-dione acylhydrolase (decyclizing)